MSEYLRGISQDEISQRIANAGSSADSQYWEDVEAEYQDNQRWLEPIAQGLLSPQEVYDREWNQQRQMNHADNMQHFTGFYHGRYYVNGNGQPR